MKCDLTIRPGVGKREGFDYRLTIFSPEPGSPDSESTSYQSLDEVESALTDAGWPEVAEKAGKTLELGHEFSHILDMSGAQKALLLRHG
jgi:hypothetical protein